MGYAATLIFGATRRGKTYRTEGRKGPEYSPLILPPLGDEVGVVQASLRSVIQLIRQGFPRLPPPPTPPPTSQPSPMTSLVPPLPPP